MIKYLKYSTKPFFFLAIIFLISCSSNPLDVDVSDINIELNVQRMEQEIFLADQTKIESEHENLKQKYGVFYVRNTETSSF